MKKLNMLMALFVLSLVWACGGGSASTEGSAAAPPPKSMVEEEADPMENKGIGPVASIKLEEVNEVLVADGLKIFEDMCTACHKVEKKFIGPSPKGIMDRRSPEWIMNMILNPDEMVIKDPIAKQLLIEANGAPMANQNLTEEQARAVLEYFRTL
ncbi:MAG: cytochrome c [Cyclobacteriaceae bacterium]|nr:cytochrome c [Cyclobacteriaceae bacterium]